MGIGFMFQWIRYYPFLYRIWWRCLKFLVQENKIPAFWILEGDLGLTFVESVPMPRTSFIKIHDSAIQNCKDLSDTSILSFV